jgi:hypothetical protein
MDARHHLAMATNAFAILRTGTLVTDGPVPTIQERTLPDIVSTIRGNMRLAEKEITPAVAKALKQAERGNLSAIRKLAFTDKLGHGRSTPPAGTAPGARTCDLAPDFCTGLMHRKSGARSTATAPCKYVEFCTVAKAV